MYCRYLYALALILAGLFVTHIEPSRGAFWIGQTYKSAPTCPENDGTSGAPAGTPPYPSLLAGTGISYATNIKSALGCNVAGVNYNVGIPSGTSLSNPTSGGLPSGCTYSAPVVTCAGTGGTFSGWDMSVSGGLQLSITADGWTVSANNFLVGANCIAPIKVASGIHTLTISQNTIDGALATCTFVASQTSLIQGILDGGNWVITYNWLKNAPEDDIDLNGAASGNAAPNISYNLFDLGGVQGHPDGVQTYGGNFSGMTVAHNTFRFYYQSSPATLTQPTHIDAQGTSSIQNTTVKFNTYIMLQSSSGTGTTCSAGSYPTDCAANESLECSALSPGPPTNQNNLFVSYGNYFDSRGALQAISNVNCTNTTLGSPYHDVDMVSGSNLD